MIATVMSETDSFRVDTQSKASRDYLAVNIDMDYDKATSDHEDDKKGHIFRSLTSTGIIPKSTRSLADWIDGIWVSGGRMLMQQPTTRISLPTDTIHTKLIGSAGTYSSR